MGKVLESITPELKDWMIRQKIFFVSTAPLSGEGHLNTSPKGGDALRVLDEKSVAYQDLTGSGVETIAHLRENGRILIMLCAFEGPPQIARLHGWGEVLLPESPGFKELSPHFAPNPGWRSIIRVTVERVSVSCGFSVPYYDYKSNRDILDQWSAKQSPEEISGYWIEKNSRSIDGLPGIG